MVLLPQHRSHLLTQPCVPEQAVGSTSGAEPLIQLQRQPAEAGSLFNSRGRTQTDVVAFWKCSHLSGGGFSPSKKKKYRNTEIHSQRLTDLASVWVVFKKKKKSLHELLSEKGVDDMRVTAVLFIRPHNQPLSTSLCAAEAPQPWKFLLPSRRASGARQTMIIVLERGKSRGQSRARNTCQQLCLGKNVKSILSKLWKEGRRK